MNIMSQFVRFLGVGGISTALQYILLMLLVSFSGVNAVVASTVGYALSAFANYSLNRRYTFRSPAAHSLALPRFVLIALVGLCINAMFMAGLNMFLELHYLLAQGLATLATLLWNFVANRAWTFKDSRVTSRVRS